MREQDSARTPSYFKSVEDSCDVDSSLVRFVGRIVERSTRNQREERERETRVSNSSSSSSLNRRHFLEDTRLSCNFVKGETSRTRGSKVFRSKRSFLDSLEFTGISGVNCPQGPC